jgi:small subunit ribosomal protein S4
MINACTICRKFGVKLFLKGSRCTSPKCALTRRNYKPGQHGPKGGKQRQSEYGIQLAEKQKAKAEYGMREKQFRRIFKTASKSRQNTGEELLKLLETRLDNIVYRLGWATSRSQAKQLVTHNNFKVNGKVVNIPSANLKEKDVITLNKKISLNKTNIPKWLKLETKTSQAQVLRQPTREEIESDLDEQLIIEFYSR